MSDTLNAPITDEHRKWAEERRVWLLCDVSMDRHVSELDKNIAQRLANHDRYVTAQATAGAYRKGQRVYVASVRKPFTIRARGPFHWYSVYGRRGIIHASQLGRARRRKTC